MSLYSTSVGNVRMYMSMNMKLSINLGVKNIIYREGKLTNIESVNNKDEVCALAE